MVTISFQVDSSEASKLFSMLKAYGVNNLTKKEDSIVNLTQKEKDILSERIKSAEKGNVLNEEEANKIFLACLK